MTRYLALMTEMGFGGEPSDLSREGDLNALDVRDDSMAILRGALGELRRPLLIPAVVVASAAILAFVLRAVAGR